jgi:hypothetical protein
MATVSVIKLKVRRGSDTDRRQITLDVGEIGYVTDPTSRRIFVGDGSTRGGNAAGLKFYTGDLDNPVNFSTTQIGDIVYNTADNKLYALTGLNVDNFPNYNQKAAYQFIGSRTDNTTIGYTVDGRLQVKANGITNTQVANSVFDLTQGLKRTAGGSVSVRYDDGTIKVNGSGALYVNSVGINIGELNTIDQSIDASNLSFSLDTLPTSDPGIPGRIFRNGGALRISI